MKKIIVAICGIILAGGAFAAPEHYQYPKQRFYSPDVWKAYNNGASYNTPIDSTLYKNLANQIGKDSHGTHDDEGAIVLIIARDIYDNGGNFCMTQIQAANQNGRRYTWLDYYDYSGKYKCKTLCRPGFYGADCSKTGTPSSCDTEILDFGDYTKKTSGEWVGQITNKTKVFVYSNSEAQSSDTTATHRILAVVKQMPHGVIVSPVEVIGDRYRPGDLNGIYSYIKSVYSNGQEFLLCAQGYEANSSKTDCVKPTWCDKKTMLDNLCDGYTTSQYREGEHKLVDGEGNCEDKTVIRCAYDGYGFDKSSSDRTCIPCNENRKFGIDSDGVCQKCTTTGDYFNGIECAHGTPIPLRQLVDGITGTAKCWLKSTLSEYKSCVRCDKGEQWDDSTNGCKPKQNQPYTIK